MARLNVPITPELKRWLRLYAIERDTRPGALVVELLKRERAAGELRRRPRTQLRNSFDKVPAGGFLID